MTAISRRSALTTLATSMAGIGAATALAGSNSAEPSSAPSILPDAALLALGEAFNVELKLNADLDREFHILSPARDWEVRTRTPEADAAYHAWSDHHAERLFPLFERIYAEPMPTTLAGFAVLAKAILFDLTDLSADLAPSADYPEINKLAELVAAMDRAAAPHA